MIRNELPDFGYKYEPEEYEVSFERIGGMDERELILPALLRKNHARLSLCHLRQMGSRIPEALSAPAARL